MEELDAAAGVLEEQDFGLSHWLATEEKRVVAVPAQESGPGGAVEKLDLDLPADPTGKSLMRKAPSFLAFQGGEHIALRFGLDLAHGLDLRRVSRSTEGGNFRFREATITTVWDLNGQQKGFRFGDAGDLVAADGFHPNGFGLGSLEKGETPGLFLV